MILRSMMLVAQLVMSEIENQNKILAQGLKMNVKRRLTFADFFCITGITLQTSVVNTPLPFQMS